MRRKLFAIAWAAFAILMGISAAYAQAENKVSTISVSGEAAVSVDPDGAAIAFGVEQTSKQAKEVQELVAKAADSLISAMQQSGVSKQDIKTGYFAVYPVYSDKAGQTSKIIGFKGSSTLVVTVRDVSKVGLLVEQGMSAGANKIENVRYTKEAVSDLRAEALGKAVADAVDKAKTIAAALGRSLGKAISVDNVRISSGSPDESFALMKAAAAQPNGFSPGTLDINASVSILFELG